VAKLFDPAQPFSIIEPPAGHLLSVELLQEPSVSLDSQWMPNLEDPLLVIDAICRLANRIEAPDWRSIFELNVKSGNHDATERVIDYLRQNPHAKIEPELMAEQRRQDTPPGGRGVLFSQK
jgi:hypothetical protein